jgi:DNA-binding SARP family transcriptional activator
VNDPPWFRKARSRRTEKEPTDSDQHEFPAMPHPTVPPPSAWNTRGPRIVGQGFGPSGPRLVIVNGDPLEPPAPADPPERQTPDATAQDVRPQELVSESRPQMTNDGRLPGAASDGQDDLPPTSSQIRVLGPVEISWRERPQRRIVTELACFLAMHTHRTVTSEEARAALWPGDSETTEASAKSLRNAVSLLRRALGPESVPEASKGGGYRLSDSVTSDWSTFEHLVAEANASSGEIAGGLLAEALGLVRGAPFQGVEPGSFSWAWTELIVARIEVGVTNSAHRLCELAIAVGDLEQAKWAALQGLGCSPYDRRLWSDLLEASSRQGRGELERSWRHASSVLGVDSTDLQALFERLRTETCS